MFSDLSGLYMCVSKWINWIISKSPTTDKIFFSVLVAQTREIGDLKLFLIGVINRTCGFR